jgi:hypothetical protein
VISFSEFKKIFSGTGFHEGELRKFYCSIKKSVILARLGKRVWPDLIKLEAQQQWPILQKIADPKLSIYQGADKELLDRFIKTIFEEKGVREQKAPSGKISHWTRLQSIIKERIELFTHIFGFSAEDAKYCARVAARYLQIIEKRTRNRKKMWKISIGAGAATLAGAAALWYIAKKKK